MIKNLTDLQKEIGVEPDGKWGPVSASALRHALRERQIQITNNISLNELLASQSAARLGIDNFSPDGATLQNLIDASNYLWQPVRDFLGHPIVINSGYRCDRLNRAIKGAKNSAHKFGLAIDFVCPGYGHTRKIRNDLEKFFRDSGIQFDQLILEYPSAPGSWIHLGYKFPGNKTFRKQIFQIGR